MAVVTTTAISAANGNGTPASARNTVDHPAQHHELALGEVHDVGSVVDQRKAKRDQRVDGADGKPGKDELQKLGHRDEGLAALGLVDRIRATAGKLRRPARSLISRAGDQRPVAVLDLEHAEGREIEAEMIGRRHVHDAAGADIALGFSISSRTLALSALLARCIASTRIIRPS